MNQNTMLMYPGVKQICCHIAATLLLIQVLGCKLLQTTISSDDKLVPKW